MQKLGHYYSIEKNYELMKQYYLMTIELNDTVSLNNLGVCYQYYVVKNYDQMKKYYLMAIALNDTETMYNLASYYDLIEKNYELMQKYCLLAINCKDDHKASFQALARKCQGNRLALYKLLITLSEESRSDYLIAKLVELEEDKMVKAYNNKVRIFKRLQNFNKCPV